MLYDVIPVIQLSLQITLFTQQCHVPTALRHAHTAIGHIRASNCHALVANSPFPVVVGKGRDE